MTNTSSSFRYQTIFRDTPIFTYDGTYREKDFLRAFEDFENRHELFEHRFPIIVAEEIITNSVRTLLSFSVLLPLATSILLLG